MAKFGYARVSTIEQNLQSQLDLLNQAGCDQIFTDTISGKTKERDGLSQLKKLIKKGDTLVVWRLDRLGRSLAHLIEWVQWLDSIGAGLHSLHESINTSTSTGKLVFHIFGALAEFERNLIRERTMVGLESAKAQGRIGGRKFVLNQEQVEELTELSNKGVRPQLLAEQFGVSMRTVYRCIKE